VATGCGHRAFAILATDWVVEVARVWYSAVTHRGYLWRLPDVLIEGIDSLTPAWLGRGSEAQARALLVGMLFLHKLLASAELGPCLRQAKRAEPGAEVDPDREFVHCAKTLVQRQLLLTEGLGSAAYPYAPGVDMSSPPPVPDRGLPLRPPSGRRDKRRAPPRPGGRWGDAGPANPGNPWARAESAPSRALQPVTFTYLEPIPEPGLHHLGLVTPVPMHLAWG